MKHNDKYVWSILEVYILYTNKNNKDAVLKEENKESEYTSLHRKYMYVR